MSGKLIKYHFINSGQLFDNEGSFPNFPDTCPHCGTGLDFIVRRAFLSPNQTETFFQYGFIVECTNNKCRKISFIYLLRQIEDKSVYQYTSYPIYTKYADVPISISKLKDPFSESEQPTQFFDVYRQAQKAESDRLLHICGAGYRRAFEFLVKDYLISLCPKEKDKIAKSWIGELIKDRIQNEKIKTLSEKCAWLGNDEVHYLRKHTDRDLKDLKTLLSALIKYIDMELTVMDAETITKS